MVWLLSKNRKMKSVLHKCAEDGNKSGFISGLKKKKKRKKLQGL